MTLPGVGPLIIPVDPFDVDRLVQRARALNDAGVEWEFDWLTQDQADAILPALKTAGILP